MALRSLLFMLTAGAVWAQTATSEFEIASVKPAGPFERGRPMGMRGGPGTNDPGQIAWNYVTLRDILVRAYAVKEYQIAGPSWLAEERYDIVAKIPAGTTREQFQLMIQNLLAERFHLAQHRTTREIQTYELVVARNGPRFKESPTAPAPDSATETRDGAPVTRLKRGADGIIELPDSMHGKGHIALHSILGAEIRVRRESLAYLVERLVDELHCPVVDRTGLTGQYDYAVAFLPENMLASAERAGSDTPRVKRPVARRPRSAAPTCSPPCRVSLASSSNRRRPPARCWSSIVSTRPPLKTNRRSQQRIARKRRASSLE